MATPISTRATTFGTRTSRCRQRRSRTTTATAATTMTTTTTTSASKPTKRPQGWTPLRYPKSAVVTVDDAVDGSSNSDLQWFPLHVDIVKATLCELVLLHQIVDPKDLSLVQTASSKASDVDAESDDNADAASNSPRRRRRRRHSSHPSHPSHTSLLDEPQRAAKKQRQSHTLTAPSPRQQEQSMKLIPEMIDEGQREHSLYKLSHVQHSNHNNNVTSAESLIQTLCDQVFDSTSHFSSTMTVTHSTTRTRRPRKVSEADQSLSALESSSTKATARKMIRVSEKGNEHQPVFMTMDLDSNTPWNQRLDIARSSSQDNFPDFWGASIADEEILRDRALEMTKRLLRPISTQTLRLFFGYKKASLTRDRLLEVLASFLFDTSHALFAWNHTHEQLVVVASSAATTQSQKDLDTKIVQVLFGKDIKAIQQIGGLDDHSILPLAIALGRLRRCEEGSSWSSFAKSPQGKRLLHHHLQRRQRRTSNLSHTQNGNTVNDQAILAAGRARRGNRLRQLRKGLLHHDTAAQLQHPSSTSIAWIGSSSSSSSSSSASTASDVEEQRIEKPVEVIDSKTNPTLIEDAPPSRVGWRQPDVSGSRVISLSKPSLKDSWGVKLSQEGTACVVLHHKNLLAAAKDNDDDDDDDLCHLLQAGDLILHVENEVGDSGGSPLCLSDHYCHSSSSNHDSMDWFQQMVNTFKNGRELRIVIQRA